MTDRRADERARHSEREAEAEGQEEKESPSDDVQLRPECPWRNSARPPTMTT